MCVLRVPTTHSAFRNAACILLLLVQINKINVLVLVLTGIYMYVVRGCIFTPPELVGLWLGSVGIQQAIYNAYEFVTCYDRCMSCTCIN